ncbi:MAG: 2-amino-4-hydroxy-6-hydroxymethyldihydropteridine diphosphokinase [Tahibacter sp.]
MTRVYLSLGSNQQPHQHLSAALTALRQRFGDIDVSPAYRFAAIGFDGPDFVNLAVGIDTDLSANALNEWLHALEARQGRRRDVPRYSDRTLDIDIVLYGDAVLNGSGNLQVPRDELRHAFVLKPLADIAPLQRHPVNHCNFTQLWKAHAQHDEPFELVELA